MIALNPKVASAAVLLVSAISAGAASFATLPAYAQTSATPDARASATPIARAMEDKLRLTGDASSAIGAFYEGRAFAPFWLTDDGAPGPAAKALLQWAGEAATHALPEARYGVPALSAKLAQLRESEDAAPLEFAMTRLFLTYARDLNSGLLEPRRINRSIHVKPRRPDPADLLAGAAAAPDLTAYLDDLAPRAAGYANLLALRTEMRQIAVAGDWGPLVPKGRTLRPGDRSSRVPALRDRLIAMGDLAPEEQVASTEVMNDATAPATDPGVFDPALEAAVRRFQERHGLNTDGAVGPQTLAAVNTTAAERARQVAVNLERMRWLNYDLGQRHIFINSAAFTMQMFEDGEPRFTTRTVVGKTSRKYQTPEFNDELEHIVVNPYWNVPSSISREEILPELKENPFYLADNNMELLGADEPASEIDWSLVTPGSFPGRVRQRPGAGNALGHVKFLFPNQFSVYMHDTPSRRLFARDRRAYSHGCVRLQDPVGFAHTLLSLQYDDPVATYDRLRAKHGEQWVTLDENIPVYVSYRTAWLGDEGVHQFRGDIYRRDRDVAAALAEAGVAVN